MEASRRGRFLGRMRNGTTLLELVVALLLIGVLTGFAFPPLAHLRDRATAVEARERFIAALRVARATAVERGGAELRVSATPARAVVLAGADTVAIAHWSELPPPGHPAGAGRERGPGEGGAALRIGGGRTLAVLAYDAAGIGRFANLTVSFVAGDASADVVVSSYGRARRR